MICREQNCSYSDDALFKNEAKMPRRRSFKLENILFLKCSPYFSIFSYNMQVGYLRGVNFLSWWIETVPNVIFFSNLCWMAIHFTFPFYCYVLSWFVQMVQLPAASATENYFLQNCSYWCVLKKAKMPWRHSFQLENIHFLYFKLRNLASWVP